MTQPIEGAIAQIATVVGTVTGIRAAPNYPPDKMTYSPFAITYLGTAHLDNGPIGTRRDIFSVMIDVLIPMRKLDNDLATLTPFHDLIQAALQAQIRDNGGKFNNSIQAWDGGLTVSYLPKVDYAGLDCRGYRYEMLGIKILVNT